MINISSISTFAPLECRLAATLPGIALAQEDAAALPADIQWMPPGRHEITALQNGEPVTATVIVDSRTASVMGASLEEFFAQAALGAGDRPYLDFNHEDGAAAGHVTEFFWGGDDPAQGGVRARVTWTQPGAEALQGRAYRRFSPSFFVNAAGEVTGAPLNLGGLVNRAAFKTIQPIWSRAADAAGQPKGTMPTTPVAPSPSPAPANSPANPPPDQSAAAGVNPRLAALEARLTALETRLAAHPAPGAIPPTTPASNPPPETSNRVAELEARLATQARDAAVARVTAAIQAGKLPPQATALHARWVEALTTHPTLADTLDSLPVNAALASIITGSTRGVVTVTAGSPGEHEFLTRARAVGAERQLPSAQAFALVAREQPALYEDYRSSLVAK